jgi:hypothetical protein
MPLPISLNIQPFVQKYNLSQGTASALASSILFKATKEIYTRWTVEAGKALRSTRSRYINAINIQNTGKYQNTIILSGKFPNMIESGVSAFDLKAGLLEGRNAKIGKDGTKYNTVPFRFATAGSVGENSAFAGVMPKMINDLADQLDATITQMGMKTKYGGRLEQDNLPTPYNQKTVRPQIIDNNSELNAEQLEAYQRKFSIFAGMIRNEKTYEKATQSSFVTFRRVSSKSPKNAFIHKGIKAYNLADKAVQSANISGVVTEVKNKTLKSLGL